MRAVLRVGGGDPAAVGGLDEHAAGDLLENAESPDGLDLHEAQVLFGGEPGESFGGEGGRDDGLNEESGDLFGSFSHRPRG